MWSTFLGQIQQRIDDAVDLLGDEEAEEGVEQGIRRGRGALSAASENAPALLPHRRAPEQQPTSPLSSVDRGSDVDGWESSEVGDQPGLTAAAASESGDLHPVAKEATARLAGPPSASSPPAPSLPEKDVSSPAAPSSPAPSTAPQSTAAPSPPVPAVEELAEQSGDSASSLLPMAAAQLCLPDDERAAVAAAHLPPPTPRRATPMESLGGSPVESPPLELGAVQSLTSSPPERTDLVTSGAALESPASERAQTPPAPTSPALPEGRRAAGSSPLPAVSTTRESLDTAQLLRFQRQLAEEMESVAALQRQNASLRERVSVLEGELAKTVACLSRAADNEQQVSLLIEKLGREKERHKAVTEERNELQEQVQELEDELEECRVREESWISGHEQQKENESAAQQRIAQLEKDAQARDTVVDNLSTQLREVTHQNSVFQNQVGELKASYSAQLDTVKESSVDTVEQLQREVEQLRSSLQNLSAEYDTRTAELEREVQHANLRSHQAESRLSEMELGSVGALQDLRGELEDLQRSSATWKAEAQKTRSECAELLDQYALLKRTRTAAEANLRDRLSAEAATVATLRKSNREWEERHLGLQATVRATQAEAEDQRKTIVQLEATIQKLTASSASVLSRSQSELLIGTGASSAIAAPLEGSPAGSVVAGRLSGRFVPAPPLNPFLSLERPTWGDATDRKTRERLEQEVVRQSAELERVRAVAADGDAWRARYQRLREEHDLLLQLYGQLEEGTNALQSNGSRIPSATTTTTTTAAAAAAAATP
ncbi:hypothetical protein NESM_000828100 [Novymonas esmeraldas]|uniref:Uncharacterized protein n=1 Tax=Novymonas esmeraldas TaxID=1808958 RepID=A0AAW0EXT0_9TRYP